MSIASNKTVLNIRDELDNCNQSHLLLGNGFSIMHDECFKYKQLIRKILKNDFEKINNLLNNLEIKNLEEVIKVFLNSKEIIDIFSLDGRETVDDCINKIRSQFLEGLSKIHPSTQNDIEIDWSVNFLSNFNKIFTVNYDLITYWVLMELNKQKRRKLNDGFWRNDDKLSWSRTDEQNLFYMHGAFHFYLNHLHDLIKESSKDEKTPLIDLLKKRLDSDSSEWPMIILEGNSEHKLRAINDSPYLKDAFDNLSNLKGVLFILGFSFSEQDSHIINSLVNNKNIDKFYIGYNSEDGKNKIEREWNKLNKNDREISFFSSSLVKIEFKLS